MKTLFKLGLVCLTLVVAEASIHSAEPTAAQKIKGALLFSTPVNYVGSSEPPENETSALLATIEASSNAAAKDRFKTLETFVETNPKSAWTPSLQIHLAEHSRSIGRYSSAIAHWEAAWVATRSSTNDSAKEIAGRALAGFANLLASLGRIETLKQLFAEGEKYEINRGVYADRIQSAQTSLRIMESHPGTSFRCGTYSLATVARELRGEKTLDPKIHEINSPVGGFNLSALVQIASTNGIKVVAARREAGGAIPVPSVVHWKLDHYAAILRKQDGFYFVKDPTFGGEQWMSEETINAEASGNFLIADGKLPDGFRELNASEAGLIHGKGCCNNPDDGGDGSGPDDGPDCPPPPPPTAGDGPGAGGGDDCPVAEEGQTEDPEGMPRWRISEPYITLWLHDIPLSYRGSSGKKFNLKINYKSRGTSKGPNVPSFGDNWECTWLGSVEDSYPVTGTPIVYITNSLAGGGKGYFPVDGGLEKTSGRIAVGASSTGISGGSLKIVNKLGRHNQYGFKLPFSYAPDRYFLTNRTDEYGRSISYVYSSNYVSSIPVIRLNSVKDMDGLSCTLAYTNATFPNLITSVTDPYNRTAGFFYDHLGRLTNITDMAGMPSSFGYNQNGVITNLTTPHGTTAFKHFAYTNNASGWGAALHRAVEVTEPSGHKQAYAYHDEIDGDTGYFATLDGFAQFRNSFHWNRQQYAEMSTAGKADLLTPLAADLRKASVKHWSHGETVGEVVEVLTAKAGPVPDGAASGSRTYQYTLDYDGRGGYAGAFHTGPVRLNQVYQVGGNSTYYARNDWGRPTNIIYTWNNVPAGYTNQYNANGRRLEKVWGPDGVRIRGYEYANSTTTNLLTAVTNAMGEVLRYTYDSALHVTSITDWSGLVTTNYYYTSGTYAGFLQTRVVVGVSTNSYSYVNGNVLCHTNELGLVTTNTWDNLNRLVCVTYPDGTTISNRYDSTKKLDLIATKDRLNNWTYLGYNSLRQLTAETNANGQVTLYDYCNCGSPSQITKLNGGSPIITTFAYDLAGRPTNATFADGYFMNYFYDANWPARGSSVRIQDASGLVVYMNNTDYGQLASVGLSQNPNSSPGGYLSQHTYDNYGRLATATDRNGITITNAYDVLGRLTNRATLDIYGYLSNTVSYAYTARGLTNSTDELGKKTWFVYDTAGRLLWQTNANNEVLQFTYNPADQMLTLKDGKNQQTSWNYDEYGRVTNKLDATSTVIFKYKYDQDDRLTNRWTVAKGDTFYRYDPIGNLTNVDYPGTIMDIVMRYDGLNRLTNVLDAIGTTKFAYNDAGQLLSEDGPWADDAVTYGYSARRRATMTINSQPSTFNYAYGYDQFNRLSNVVSAAGNFIYGYASGVSDRVATLGLSGQSYYNERSYIYNEYDLLARLTDTKLHGVGGVVRNQHSYAMNEANQRTKQTLYDGNNPGGYGNTHAMDYTYDDIGQLKTAKGTDRSYDYTAYDYVETPRKQEQFGYAYDKAWNLNYRTNNALTQTFNTDTKNQLTTATRSGTLTVAGQSTGPRGGDQYWSYPPGVTNVVVSGTGLSSGNADLYADGSWARAGATLANGNNTYTATAKDTYDRTASDSLTLNLPSTITFQYDGNGNLTNDGRRVFEYDYENQLTNVYVASAWRSEFRYDAFGRKRIQRDYAWQSSAWVKTNEVKYVYDGMLVIQERHVDNPLSTIPYQPVITYTRGNDLSGSLQGAGGIGGLLARTENVKLLTPGSALNAHAYYHADGNGNITAMVNTNGIVVARYNYDPYGNLLGMSGPLAEANTYRFSSKEWNGNAGLYYYGFRFYEPNVQRWLNRDPLGDIASLGVLVELEDGAYSFPDAGEFIDQEEMENTGLSPQLMGYAYNNPVSLSDADGRIAPLAALWLACRIGMTVWNVYEIVETIKPESPKPEEEAKSNEEKRQEDKNKKDTDKPSKDAPPKNKPDAPDKIKPPKKDPWIRKFLRGKRFCDIAPASMQWKADGVSHSDSIWIEPRILSFGTRQFEC